jgi:hypothetical protein
MKTILTTLASVALLAAPFAAEARGGGGVNHAPSASGFHGGGAAFRGSPGVAAQGFRGSPGYRGGYYGGRGGYYGYRGGGYGYGYGLAGLGLGLAAGAALANDRYYESYYDPYDYAYDPYDGYGQACGQWIWDTRYGRYYWSEGPC